ncbi:MAG: phosphate ABC transporter permease subunit PstC [Deltaproteobacteria bacterium]|nr:phosphate ABC transporter permease subunit PstC [Deltaproteobacteria bacterium]
MSGAPPRRAGSVRTGDRLWRLFLLAAGCGVFLLTALILIVLARLALPVLHQPGTWAFLTSSDWDPVAESFGALPFVWGTLVTSAVAVVLAFPVGLGVALFITEVAPTWLRRPVTFAIELLSAVPSVVYGLWGLFIVVPWLRETVEPALGAALGFLPLFSGPPLGLGYLAAGLVLAVMVLPTLASVSIEVMRTVPAGLRESAYALGATQWEVVRLAVLPHSRSGLVGALVLGTGRALGETMAVAMLIGNAPSVGTSLFAPGYSLASVIANEFAEAGSDAHVGALAALGLVLFLVTIAFNAAARLLIGRRQP